MARKAAPLTRGCDNKPFDVEPHQQFTRAYRHAQAIVSISELFIRRPIATSLLMAALALVGVVAFPLLPVAPLPEVDFPTIQVSAQLAGASPDTIASTVAAPLERRFGEISGITR